MSYSCLEELQVDLDLHTLNLNKISVLSKAGRKYNDGWLVITNDGICHLFDKDGNLDDIEKIQHLEEKHIRKDITKIVIPNSVKSIGKWAFFNCSCLTSVAIPDSVTNIGDMAFEDCTGLTSMTIPNSVTSIGYGVLSGCNGLTSVTIPDLVTSIGGYAFYNCSGLTSVTIPDSVTNIGEWAFAWCSGLTSVTIGNGVTSIGDWAFYNCDALTNLTFKGKTLKQVKKMDDYPWGIKDESIIRVK